ncbi:MAG: hypothetical protein JO211_05375 [Acidobacteriaceae bacterium]|nr:hypothetical protein [Acidobacteriaceae bacterium]
MTRFCFLTLCLALAASAQTQEPDYGISVPFTFSGNLLYTHGFAGDDYTGNSTTIGFRAVLSPTVRLGDHWFFYSALETHSSNYFRYRSGLDTNQFARLNLMQAFLGYTTTFGNSRLLLKVGQLSSAFGSFPVEYDDAKDPFPNPPPAYVAALPLRPDQRPCGVPDLLYQDYASDIQLNCGGSNATAYGTLPVTIYGLPGIEAQIASAHIDARLQLTNSSPSNPQGLNSNNQFLEWTAGGGYSVAGLRVGMSGFHGPYLDRVLDPFLPAGAHLRNFPASGIGVDPQWAHSRWSAEGEWQQFRFDEPGFIASPSEHIAYAQLKTILSPRTYAAVRATSLHTGFIRDAAGASANFFTSPEQVYEFAFGYRPDRFQVLKLGYDWTHRIAWSTNGTSWLAGQVNGISVQLVTAFTSFSSAFR